MAHCSFLYKEYHRHCRWYNKSACHRQTLLLYGLHKHTEQNRQKNGGDQVHDLDFS